MFPATNDSCWPTSAGHERLESAKKRSVANVRSRTSQQTRMAGLPAEREGRSGPRRMKGDRVAIGILGHKEATEFCIPNRNAIYKINEFLLSLFMT